MTSQPSQPQVVEPLDLTPTEVRVLYHLFNPDLDQSDIAREMSVSRSAVSFHTVSIYSKLHVSTRFEAICKYAQIDLEYFHAFVDFLKQNKAA